MLWKFLLNSNWLFVCNRCCILAHWDLTLIMQRKNKKVASMTAFGTERTHEVHNIMDGGILKEEMKHSSEGQLVFDTKVNHHTWEKRIKSNKKRIIWVMRGTQEAHCPDEGWKLFKLDNTVCVLALRKQKLNFWVVIKDLVSKYLQIVLVWRTDADMIAKGDCNVIVGVRDWKKPQGIFVEGLALKMIYGWFKKETKKIIIRLQCIPSDVVDKGCKQP